MRITVLIIDGDEHTRDVFRVFLEHHGYVVFEAPTGEAGIRYAREAVPDLAIVEEMPAPGAISVLAALRDDPKTADIRVLVVTAYAGELIRQRAFEAGADGFLTKPTTLNALLKEVHRLVGVVKL